MSTKMTHDCPSCGREILAHARKCRHCGSASVAGSAPDPAPTPPVAAASISILTPSTATGHAPWIISTIVLSIVLVGQWLLGRQTSEPSIDRWAVVVRGKTVLSASELGCTSILKLTPNADRSWYLAVFGCDKGFNRTFAFRPAGDNLIEITDGRRLSWVKSDSAEWLPDGSAIEYSERGADDQGDTWRPRRKRVELPASATRSGGDLLRIVHRVSGVSSDDVLNLRSSGSSRASVLAGIPPTGRDIVFAGQLAINESERWMLVDWEGVRGWVNERFLVGVLAPGSDAPQRTPMPYDAMRASAIVRPVWAGEFFGSATATSVGISRKLIIEADELSFVEESFGIDAMGNRVPLPYPLPARLVQRCRASGFSQDASRQGIRAVCTLSSAQATIDGKPRTFYFDEPNDRWMMLSSGPPWPLYRYAPNRRPSPRTDPTGEGCPRIPC